MLIFVFNIHALNEAVPIVPGSEHWHRYDMRARCFAATHNMPNLALERIAQAEDSD